MVQNTHGGQRYFVFHVWKILSHPKALFKKVKVKQIQIDFMADNGKIGNEQNSIDEAKKCF